ncbi:efflux RND transporter periplasmic adaptor subunit [Singulisphaera sp. PoT]|uniref:efflux RND transporter periplasmic adaptor subunit n=1 Tax=Singulisphaera sp. PoT TaxID=3411797 RepID=UPI003BF47FEB
MSTPATKNKTARGHAAPGKFKSAIKWAFCAAAFLTVAGAVGWYSQFRGIHASTHNAEALTTDQGPGDSEQVVPVETTHTSPGGIMRLSTQIGSVHPYEEADLYAKVSGYLSKLYVDYGDRVKQDQVIAEIDDPEIVKESERAAADVEQAKAAVVQSEAFIESAKADRDAAGTAIEQAAAEVDRYTSMRTFHEKKFARYNQLVSKRAIPQQIADEEEESYESARSSEVASHKAVLNAKAQFNAAAARVKKAEADLTEAKANVDVAQAKLAKAQVFVGYTRIRAPYDGVITKRNFFRGAFIRSASEGGAIPLVTVARTDMVRVVTEVPDRDVPLADVGDDAEVTLDALGAAVFKGKVSRFAETEDPTSRTMHTEIDLPNPDNKIRAGMYGITKIMLDKSTKSMTLPASVVVGESKGGKADIYVIKNGRVKKVQITVGSDDGLRVEVLSGLKPDDEVIVSTGSVSEGTRVRSEGEPTHQTPRQ